MANIKSGSKAEKSNHWLNSVISDTVVIEMRSSPSPEEAVEWSRWSPTLESPPSTQLEVFADQRKLGQTDWKIGAKPSRPRNLNTIDRENLFEQKLANWMQTVGLEPTTFRPKIVQTQSDRFKLSDVGGNDVYEFPETLFYENVKKWAEEESNQIQVKRPVPRSGSFYGYENW